MAYFSNITSFGELKKQYRILAIANHPDKGGDTKVMQEINIEFEKLYKTWEHRNSPTDSRTGYEDDYRGASSKQYTDYVYNEYNWKGSRYKGQGKEEILDLIRKWFKETYPHYKFSVTRRHYNSFTIKLLQADFEPFIAECGVRAYHDVNHYHIGNDKYMTDRAKEVMSNIRDYIMSYNYDNSDAMTDYFDTNFYLSMVIGSYKSPYKCVIPQLTCAKNKLAPEFKYPEGKAHKAIRQALGGAVFKDYECRNFGKAKVLGEITYRSDGEEDFYPFSYGGYKTALKRVEKLQAAGINCHVDGRKYSSIIFDGYTPQTEAALERERQEYAAAKKLWDEQQSNPKTAKKEKVKSIQAEGIQLIDYSEKAFAIIGDTKPIKEKLKELGGMFNGRLSCGAGWIFPKSKTEIVKQALSIA